MVRPALDLLYLGRLVAGNVVSLTTGWPDPGQRPRACIDGVIDAGQTESARPVATYAWARGWRAKQE